MDKYPLSYKYMTKEEDGRGEVGRGEDTDWTSGNDSNGSSKSSTRDYESSIEGTDRTLGAAEDHGVWHKVTRRHGLQGDARRGGRDGSDSEKETKTALTRRDRNTPATEMVPMRRRGSTQVMGMAQMGRRRRGGGSGPRWHQKGGRKSSQSMGA